MQRVWPIIAVENVQRSSSWYQQLLSASQTHPGSTVFDQILSGDNEVLVCLHHRGPSGARGDHRWSAFKEPPSGTTQGLMLWFVVDDFEAAWQQALALAAVVDEPPNNDNGTGQRAFVIRDPDGYFVAVNES